MPDRSSEGNPDSVAQLVSGSVPSLLEALGAGTDPDLVPAVEAAVEPVRLAAGETLLRTGDAADAAYFVVTGRLLVLVEEEEREVVIRRLGRGEIIGEIGLMEGSARTATIRADRESTLGRLSREAFDRLAADYPAFLMGITRTVVQRIAHPRPPVDTVGSVAVAIAHRGVDADHLLAGVLRQMETRGPSIRLSSADVDARLGAAGAAMSRHGGGDHLRMHTLLDSLEAEHRFVLLEAGREVTPWSDVVLSYADRVVIVVGPRPDSAEEQAAHAFAEAARTGHRPEVWLAVVRPPDDGVPTGTAALAARFGADRIVHLRDSSGPDVDRMGRLVSGIGIGLVLGGGGARGFAHMGVYRALTELGVPVDAVAGASMGGIIGAVIASGRTPDEITEIAASGFRNVLDYTLPLVSMVKGGRITRQIDAVFAGLDIEDLPIPFLCVSTNLTTSREVIHDHGSVSRAIRAGSALPGVIPPVPSDGDLLVDGGVLDNLPIGPLRASGLVDTVIAVDVAPTRGPRARLDYGLTVSGWKALGSKLRRRRRVYPALSSLLARSMIVGSAQLRDRQVAAGYADLYLDPDLRGIPMLAFDRIESVAEAGYEAALPQIESWWRARRATTAPGEP